MGVLISRIRYLSTGVKTIEKTSVLVMKVSILKLLQRYIEKMKQNTKSTRKS